MLHALVIEGEAKFEREISQNEAFFFPLCQFTGPQVKNGCSREVILCIKIGHVCRSCEKLLVASSCLPAWNSWVSTGRIFVTFYSGKLEVCCLPGPPHCRDFPSHSDTPLSVGLLWTGDQPDSKTSDTTQHLQETDIRAPGGIRTCSPNKRAASDPFLRPRGHWDGP